jgi:probable F420-dependent oxidoreductase
MMQVGIHVPQIGPAASRDNVVRFAKTAEEVGFDTLWVLDHVVLRGDQGSTYPYSPTGSLSALCPPGQDLLEPLTEVAFLAAVTERVQLATSVLILPMRQPVLHAKVIATIDHLSQGRFLLGAGVGWWREEFEVLGAPFERRGARMDECLQVLKTLWSDERAEFHGEFYDVPGWACDPKPANPSGIPIWLGGESKKQLERVGKHADGWIATRNGAVGLGRPRGTVFPSVLDDFEIAKQAARAAGRDPADLRLAVDGAGQLSAETMGETANFLAELKEAGVFHALLWMDPVHTEQPISLLETFAAKYLPALQQ